MEDHNYIGLFRAKETDIMLDKINKLIRKTFGENLPSTDQCSLRQIHFCCNAKLKNPAEVKLILIS